MARLNDELRKKIAADYVECQNYRQVARMNGVSDKTVKKAVMADPESKQKCAQKKEDNTANILAYMDDNAAQVKLLIGKMLQAMEHKVDNLDMFTGLRDLATAYGIVIDKMFKLEELQQARRSQASESMGLWIDAMRSICNEQQA